MEPARTLSRIVLTPWNASVFEAATLRQLLPELVIYALLYDDVLIREEDLISNRAITRFLTASDHLDVFEELLTAGLVKLLRLPVETYPGGRRFDPVRLPISARAEEHQLRRSYRGRPWKPTASECGLFKRLDDIVVSNPASSRFHAPFPPGNRFAAELAELLENRDQYRLGVHPIFRYIDATTADAFIRFCREPDAWRRFLVDGGAKSIIVGPDGGFYRSAAHQCSRLLPTPRSMERLVESVYAATYCDREDSDGRYAGSRLVELPYRYCSNDEQEEAAATITRIERVPTGAAASIAVGPGIASVLVRTRESASFDRLQRTIQQLGSVSSDSLLPSEASFTGAWRDLCEVYAVHSTSLLVKQSRIEKTVARYGVFAYVLARVLGFVIVPAGPLHTELPVAEDAAAIAAIGHWGPYLLKGLRAALKTPGVREAMANSAAVRCSRVSLNTTTEK